MPILNVWNLIIKQQTDKIKKYFLSADRQIFRGEKPLKIMIRKYSINWENCLFRINNTLITKRKYL